MRSLFSDVRDAFKLASGALADQIPTSSNNARVAKILGKLGLARGISNLELHDHLYRLYFEHDLAGQLALLAAAEGDVRQRADEIIANQRYARYPKLRKVLLRYDDAGLPDRFRALIEELISALECHSKELTRWKRLIVYRNWLAHGQQGAPPCSKIPSQADLERDIEQSITNLRAAMDHALKR